ncbi:unnamed protein product [Dovyalis caffra]|uniref:FAD-binding 8 domain-containing protein n=1 Tax=Dovyalis caffra TaxID=77055 RepID=A0AAV1RTL7_9ROSI|nr:unnamed protein product [Dovyalis caffra]
MEQDKLSVVVKRLGSWSQKLYQEISSPLERLEVSVEGPYGPASSHFQRLVYHQERSPVFRKLYHLERSPVFRKLYHLERSPVFRKLS